MDLMISFLVSSTEQIRGQLRYRSAKEQRHEESLHRVMTGSQAASIKQLGLVL